MRTISEKRKEFMDLLIKVMNALDPSGVNAKTYIDRYSKLSDKEFDKQITEFFNDEEAQFYLEVVEYERDLTYDNIAKAAKILNVPLYERVAMPYINRDENNIVVSPEPVPVGYIHVKRMMQTLQKKNAGSTRIRHRNSKTGQVIGEDKNGRETDAETFSMLAIGATEGLKEMFGPRADDAVAKNQMYTAISKNGYVSINDLDIERENKVAINTLDVYFTSMGLKTNLINSGKVILAPK